MQGKNKQIGHISISEYDYELPEGGIAKYPLSERDASKLLVYRGGKITENRFHEISTLLPGKSLLVFNDTRVIQARLLFHKSTGATIEIFCLEPHQPANYENSFAITGECQWKCLVGNLKRWKNEEIEMTFVSRGRHCTLKAAKIADYQNWQLIKFRWTPNFMTFSEVLEMAGKTPIPPYLHREAEPLDKERYQTVYAHYNGSVAAPTAGLHFTPRVFEKLDEHSISHICLTLHVGAGTFRPVQTINVNEHEMHTEHFSIRLDALESIIKHKGKIIAAGTTTLRTLESLYWCGVELLSTGGDERISLPVAQWSWVDSRFQYNKNEALHAIISYMKKHRLEEFHGSTQLMILPGYPFHVIDGLITNFHQPRSTLLLLVAAYVGNDWKKIYDFALYNEFRFLSYGDTTLLLKD